MTIKQILMALIVCGITLPTSAQRVLQLPAPQTHGGEPLMTVMKNRCSMRDINPDSEVTQQELSDMLWAAWGITHDGKRTVATARNCQELEFYVVTKDGTALYDAETNSLKHIKDGDFRKATGKQDFAFTAPLNIVIVADNQKQTHLEFEAYAAGAASQNIYLYCAQAGLKTVVRAMFDNGELAKALNLEGDKRILFVQTVGR